MLLFDHEKGLQRYNAKSPLQKDLFSISVSIVSDLLKNALIVV